MYSSWILASYPISYVLFAGRILIAQYKSASRAINSFEHFRLIITNDVVYVFKRLTHSGTNTGNKFCSHGILLI